MNRQVIKLSDMQRFTSECFDEEKEGQKAARILKPDFDRFEAKNAWFPLQSPLPKLSRQRLDFRRRTQSYRSKGPLRQRRKIGPRQE